MNDHFDGTHFHNEAPFDVGLGDLLRFYASREPGEWVRNLEVPPASPPPARVDDGSLRLTFINHATVLVQVDGLNVLTDPIWSQRASPLSWVGPRRYRPPGIRFSDLPPIDVVVISHNHYDHLDIPTMRRLAAAHQPLFVVPAGDQVLLERAGIAPVLALDWWQSQRLANGCALTAVPVKHWSGRTLGDRNLSLWAGYVIESAGGPIYFAGDTGYDDHFAEAYARFGPMRAALLPIGAYKPRWLTAYQHMDPTDAVRAHLD
ncbi:MAG: MBL fold metallo-hydrolase, partial [Algiphilus sp.]